jgi:hypothetical protein
MPDASVCLVVLAVVPVVAFFVVPVVRLVVDVVEAPPATAVVSVGCDVPVSSDVAVPADWSAALVSVVLDALGFLEPPPHAAATSAMTTPALASAPRRRRIVRVPAISAFPLELVRVCGPFPSSVK